MSCCTEPTKKRSVRFNDDALETVVAYTTPSSEDDMMLSMMIGTRSSPLFGSGNYNIEDDNDVPRCHRDRFQRLCDIDDEMFTRSGSHQSLYDKMEVPTGMISVQTRKQNKRNSDLDNSNHYSRSSSTSLYYNKEKGQICTNRDNIVSSSTTARSQRYDLDVSYHDSRHEHRVICF